MSDAGSQANRADAQHRPRENAPSPPDYPPVDVASLGESEANAVRNSAPPAGPRAVTPLGADGVPGRQPALRTHHLGRGVRARRGNFARPVVTRRGDVLHVGTYAQRGSVSVPAHPSSVR